MEYATLKKRPPPSERMSQTLLYKRAMSPIKVEAFEDIHKRAQNKKVRDYCKQGALTLCMLEMRQTQLKTTRRTDGDFLSVGFN